LNTHGRVKEIVMKPQLPGPVTATFALALLPVFLAGAGPPADNRVVPEEALAAMVRDANRFIREAVKGEQPVGTDGRHSRCGVISSNALLIALAAQNRMGNGDEKARQLATLRDTAVSLAAAVQNKPCDPAEVARLAGRLARFPDLKPDPQARTVRYRLKDHFDHGHIAVLFGGCGGHHGHRIQADLEKFGQQTTPFTAAEREKIRLVAYKVALLGELLRDFDDYFVLTRTQQRKEWVRRAVDTEYAAWELAEASRADDPEGTKATLRKLNATCADCHRPFFP
jgi:hypothetical protein